MDVFYYDTKTKKTYTVQSLELIYSKEELDSMFNDTIFPVKEIEVPDGKFIEALLNFKEKENGGPIYNVENGYAIRDVLLMDIDITNTRYSEFKKLLVSSICFNKVKNFIELQEEVNSLINLIDNLILENPPLSLYDETNEQYKIQFKNIIESFYQYLNDEESDELRYIFNRFELGLFLPNTLSDNQ